MNRLTIGCVFAAMFSLMPAIDAAATDTDFSRGVFIINEDWYGHQNSTVNYLDIEAPEGEEWHYRVLQEANPGMELGCTAQHGAIWDGRFYIVSKQAKDPGASVTGGRITVADAATMEILWQSELIDPSGQMCDGRGFLGVDAHKGYVSSSNGIWCLDLDNYSITGRVEGSSNPSGSLYKGQCGSMVMSAGRVFAAHQQYGLLVIDPATDKVVRSLPLDFVKDGAGIGSVVKSRDGSVWLSVAGDVNGNGSIVGSIVRVDPVSLETEVIEIPDGMYGPSNSWYAWTPDSFCASSVTDALYWCGGSSSWFAGSEIYRYDIKTSAVEKIIDLDEDGEGCRLYGCSMRLHPVTDEIYMSLYRGNTSRSYITRRYSADGTRLHDYEMIENYWFPSVPVFTQDKAGNSGVGNICHDTADGEITVALSGRTLHVAAGESVTHVNVYTPDGRIYASLRLHDGEAEIILEPGLYIAGGRKIYCRAGS